MTSPTIFGYDALFPRRRRSRTNWNKHHHHHQQQEQRPNQNQRELPDDSLSTMTQPLFNSDLRARKPLAVAFLMATCFLVVLFANIENDTHILTHTNSNGTIQTTTIVDTTDDAQLALRRRLLPEGRSLTTKLLWADNGVPGAAAVTDEHEHENYENREKSLRYLTFGGPLTFGRGLDESKRTLEAYPYLLSPSNKNTRVRNVAYPTYDAMDPRMVSLCTQSIVEGINESIVPTAKQQQQKIAPTGGMADDDLLPLSSILYDVITLEYSFAAASTFAGTSKEAFLSSIRLLVRRLKQRYPLATILLVELWTPSDLVHLDPVSNRTISFDEWRRNEMLQQQHQEQQQHPSLVKKIPSWTLRELSQTEKEVAKHFKSFLAFEGGLVLKLPLPNTLPDGSIGDFEDLFLEERDEDTMKDIVNGRSNHVDPSSSPRYTLSREGHAAVARGIRALLGSAPFQNRQTPVGSEQQQQQQQLLYTWGSGDSCRLWYDTGHLPNPKDCSGGLKPATIDEGSYALEVTGSGANLASLRVHNPFGTDRMVYLTYLTASERAASNKVYPRTRVRMVAEAPSEGKHDSNGQITLPRQPGIPTVTSVILDPSHITQNKHNEALLETLHHDHHLTRTTAVGLVRSYQTGILEFSTLEEYTVHPFRIVGISILPDEIGTKRDDKDGNNQISNLSFEFSMVSPKRLSFTLTEDDDEDDDEVIDDNGDTER